jgi:glucose-1-phosphate thymidylyltransferase
VTSHTAVWAWEYEISDAIDLLIQSGRTIDAIPLDGWRVDVEYPEDRDKAEDLLQEDKIEA